MCAMPNAFRRPSSKGPLRRWIVRAAIWLPVILIAGCLGIVAFGWLRAPALAALEMAHVATPLSIADLPPEHLRILIQVEDPAFSTHHGLDLTTPGAGMTTITQGLAKLLYFESFRPGLAKLPQSLLALGLDARLSKDELMTLFLNRVPLGASGGREIRGFEEAARAYFGLPAAHLTRDQWLALVAMCVGPNAFHVAMHPDRNQSRVLRIERLLSGRCRAAGWLDVYYESCA